MTVLQATEEAKSGSHSIVVGVGSYVSRDIDIAKIVRMAIETSNALRLNVAEEAAALVDSYAAMLAPPSLWLTHLGHGAESSSLQTEVADRSLQSPYDIAGEILQSSATTERGWSVNRRVPKWYRLPSNAASDSRAQVYLEIFKRYGALQTPLIAEEASWLAELDQRIVEFARGMDARVTEETARQARAVLRQFGAEMPRPQVKPSVDGDVLFIWHNHGDLVEVNLDAEGYTSWFGRFSGVYEPGGELHGHDVLPSSLQEMLHRLHG